MDAHDQLFVRVLEDKLFAVDFEPKLQKEFFSKLGKFLKLIQPVNRPIF